MSSTPPLPAWPDWRSDPDGARAAFRSEGYFVARGFLDAGELAELRADLERFLRDLLPTLGEHAFYEERGRPETLKQIQLLQRWDPRFGARLEGSRFERLAAVLLGEPVVGKNLQYFDKPPGASRPTPPHQDGHYFMIAPCEALTMWLALDEVDLENGCLRYLPGSHRGPLRPHARTRTLGFSQGIPDYGEHDEPAAEVALDAAPGDLFAHHALTVHRADANASPTRHRRALGFIYYAARAREDARAHEEYRRRLHDELAAEGRI